MTDYWIVQVCYHKNWHGFWKFIKDGKDYFNNNTHPHRFKSEQECMDCIKQLKIIDPSLTTKYRTCHYTVLREFRNY